jgi:hypothetical protein
MLETARKQPSVFFGIAQRLIPTQVQMDLQATVPGSLSPSDWADLSWHRSSERDRAGARSVRASFCQWQGTRIIRRIGLLAI